MNKLRRILTTAAVSTAGVLFMTGLAATSSATENPYASYFNFSADGACPAYGKQEICSGWIPSWDNGVRLDVDVTRPINESSDGRHPLIIMLNGLGGTKHEWESLTDEGDGRDKWHWNSHWFAKHGYYVLTYTPRGFRHEDEPHQPWQPDTPSFNSLELPSGTAHLKSRDFELKDTQWLAAIVASVFPDVDPNKVAVTGGSYGGGETWTLASQAEWTFPNQVDPSLPVLDLQVALPRYSWTDLAYSVAPNGHGGGPARQDLYESSQGRPDDDAGRGNPVGVVKESYVTGFYVSGSRKGVFESGTATTPSEEGKISIPAWFERAVVQGDPYDVAGVEDPIIAQARRGLTEFRSAYYQDEQWESQVGQREVAVFSIQGWTDDLFTAVESFRQFKYLKRLDPLWPVSVAVADVGHSRAQNKAATWRRLNDRAWQFLQSHVDRSHRHRTTVYSEPTICANDADSDNNLDASYRLTATTPEGLSNGTLAVNYTRGDTLTWQSGATDPNGPVTDPAFGDRFDQIVAPSGPCRTADGPAVGGYTAVSQPLPDATTYVGLGFVEVPYTLIGGNTATLHARVWDVTENGPTLLVTRGTYRLSVPRYDSPAGTLRLPLFGNHWKLDPGHKIRLDLVQVDHPTFRPSNVPSTIEFGPPRLVLPTRESGDRVVTGV